MLATCRWAPAHRRESSSVHFVYLSAELCGVPQHTSRTIKCISPGEIVLVDSVSASCRSSAVPGFSSTVSLLSDENWHILLHCSSSGTSSTCSDRLRQFLHLLVNRFCTGAQRVRGFRLFIIGLEVRWKPSHSGNVVWSHRTEENHTHTPSWTMNGLL